MPIRFYLHTYARADGRSPIYADIRWGRGDDAIDDLSRLPQHWEGERVKSAQTGYLKINNKLAEFEKKLGQLIEMAEREATLLSAEQLLA